MSKKKHIEIKANTKSFQHAQAFVEDVLHSRKVNTTIASETMLLFEAIFHNICEQAGEETTIDLSTETLFGRTEVKICYEGARFDTTSGDVSIDPEAKIIEVLSDKFSCSYRSGYNVIKITVHKSAKAFMLPNLAAILLAVIISIPISLILDPDAQKAFATDWVAPLEKLFTNAIMMIGAPMTLFSLLKNSTDAFIVAERHSTSRQLFGGSLASSIVAVVLAIFYGGFVGYGLLAFSDTTEKIELGFSNWSFASAVDGILPSNILEPFQTISPVPMILVALLITYALVSIGSDFEPLKRAIDVCYSLFSRILNIIMTLFPAACFLLCLDVLLENGVVDALAMIILVVLVFVGAALLLATYAIRLKFNGIKVRDFVKKIKPLVKENFQIGSVIDAVPYNVRYCTKVFGFSRQRLEKELPVMAQTNLDGNCFIIMLTAMFYIAMSNTEVSVLNIIVIAIIVLFLSFGAPNQPGSILIGTMIVFAYLNVNDTVALALFFELFCGGLQNIINVISSIVSVAEHEAKDAKRISGGQ